MVKVFNIKKLVIMIGWAKSLTWCVTTEQECRTLYFSLHKVTQAFTGYRGYGIIIGPITIMFGYSN